MSQTDAPLVIVFPTGQLSPKDKERFTKAGIIACESDDPKSVVQLRLAKPLHLETTGITGDAIVRSLLSSIAKLSPENTSGSITYAGRAAHNFICALAAEMELSAKDKEKP